MSYERLFRSALFPAYEWATRRNTHRYLAEYQASQWLKPAHLATLQLSKLNRLLTHAWSNVPALAERWRAHGLAPRMLKSAAELADYPILSKQDISSHYDGMVARNWRGRTLTKTTGGSTGEPFRFEYTMESYARRTAVMWRGYDWAGAGLGARTAYLWGTGLRKGGWGGLKDQLYHGAFNRSFLDAFSMRDDNIGEYVDRMRAFRPDAVVGYVAPVVQVARWLNEQGTRIEGLRGVLTGAESLYEPQRKLIEQAFGTQVFNTYGCREFMLIASECERHQGLHVNADHLVVETVNELGVPVHGESGDVVVTDLSNYGMPMIRYRNGDRATYVDRPCTCGRALPLFASVDGRILDLIHTPDGRRVPGEFIVYAMLDFNRVSRYQAVQVEADRLELRIVSAEPLSPDESQRIMVKLRQGLGTVMRIDIRRVPDIPLTASGKRRVSVSLANAAQHRLDPAA